MNYAWIISLIALAAPAAPAVEAPEYTVTVAADGPYAAGTAGTVTLTVNAHAGYHVNPEYPVTFKPEGSEGLKFAEERIKLTAGAKTACADSAKDSCVVSYPVTMTPEKAGPAKFAGTFGFSVCTPKTCLMKKVPVTVTLTAK